MSDRLGKARAEEVSGVMGVEPREANEGLSLVAGEWWRGGGLSE